VGQLGGAKDAMKTEAAWRAAMASDTGFHRSNNEDRVYMDEARGVFIVVDGVGGHAAGEKAAEMAVEIIPRELEASDGSMQYRVLRAITLANNEIYQLSQENSELRGMACVLTLAVAHDDKITVGHVGDSRLYLIWNGTVKKLTSDHSPVGEREDHGELTELEAMVHPRRNEVYRDVGSRFHESQDEHFIEIRSLPFHPEAAILLCSDGLSDALTSLDIGDIVNRYDGDPGKIAQLLVNAANGAGGKDNVSVIFVAGPEFLGSASEPMAEARARHAITRMRGGPKLFHGWLRRIALLVIGMLLGALAWILIERKITRPVAAGPIETATRLTHYSVDPANPHGIANALSTARAGDVIEIPPGQYIGPVYLKDGVVLLSRSAGTVFIRSDSAAEADPGIAVVARGINGARLSSVGILSDHEHPLKLGVAVTNSDVELDEAEISGATDAAIAITGSSKGLFRNNYIHDNPGGGIRIEQNSSPNLTGNRLFENGLQPGALKPGIEIHPPAKPQLVHNVISGNGSDALGPISPEFEADLRRANIFTVMKKSAQNQH
jgi:parallel beta-helix repeat protein